MNPLLTQTFIYLSHNIFCIDVHLSKSDLEIDSIELVCPADVSTSTFCSLAV